MSRRGGGGGSSAWPVPREVTELKATNEAAAYALIDEGIPKRVLALTALYEVRHAAALHILLH
jgi:hypothetical protein